MVSGTGEAPSGIVCYESDGFPEDYRGTLLVGSWGDHRIDQFVLKPRGASFEAIPHPIIKGGQDFRPVGLAVAPDGSLYVTDWVSKEYKLHGKGRVWRVSSKVDHHRESNVIGDAKGHHSTTELVKSLDSPILNTRRLAARQLATTDDGRKWLDKIRHDKNSGERSRFEATRASADYVETEPHLNIDAVDLSDPFIMSKAIHQIAGQLLNFGTLVQASPNSDGTIKSLIEQLSKPAAWAETDDTRKQDLRQMMMMLAFRMKFPNETSLAHLGIERKHPLIRRLAVQWIGEENLKELRPDVEFVLASEPMTTDLFMACLASLSLLDGVAPREFEKTPPAQYLLEIVTNSQRPATLRATALRLLSPTQKELDAKLLGEMLATKEPDLRRETVRTLQHSTIAERDQLLRGVASDESLDVNVRADAVAGLGAFNPSAPMENETRDLLIKLTSNGTDLAIRLEAIRALRGIVKLSANQSPRDAVARDRLQQLTSNLARESDVVRKALSEALEFCLGSPVKSSPESLLAEMITTESDQPGNSEFGRRTFFHVNAAGCYKCHTIGGRGGLVGPDLTVIARTMDRKKLAESILEPGKEISPQFTTWAIETKSGKTLTGLLLGEEVNGDLRLGNSQGEVFFVPFNDIETRTPLKTSIMPEKLHETMTKTELYDLISFLGKLR